MVEIDPSYQYVQLKRALKDGKILDYSSDRKIQIKVEKNKQKEMKGIRFTLEDTDVTYYDAQTGDVSDLDMYQSFFEHLNYKIITNVLENAAALDMAFEEELIPTKPQRIFEKVLVVKKYHGILGHVHTVHEMIIAKKEDVDKELLDDMTIEGDVTLRFSNNVSSDGWLWWGVVFLRYKGRRRMKRDIAESALHFLSNATGYNWYLDTVSNFVAHFKGPQPPDPRFPLTTIDEPTKVKHKTGTDGKILITIPVRRSIAEKLNLSKNDWIKYAIRKVDPPKNTKRVGGEGPRHKKKK